jgi:uncharacterized protein
MQLRSYLDFAQRALVLSVLCGLTACTSVLAPGSGPASVDKAERLLKQGNPAAAAQMYSDLASQNSLPESVDQHLAAARAWLAANRGDDAQRSLEAAGTTLTPAQQFEKELVSAETAMARGQYAPAWRQLSAVPEPRQAQDAARLFQLQQKVALRAGQPMDAVRAGMARERVASNDADRTRVRRDLLTDLRGAIDSGLKLDLAAAREPIVRGWLEIAQIASAAGRSPLGASSAIDRWRARYPAHPAAAIAVGEIVTPASRPDAPRTVAVVNNTAPIGLLLPLTGRAAVPAALVRDGFLAAIERLPEASRPTVKIYDTGALSMTAAIAQAQSDGAGFMVGPLTREEVQAAAEQRPGSLPFLLLNSLVSSGSTGAPLYQYALAPEDEARQIARHIFASGQRNAIVLAPTGDWGNRVAAAFNDELTVAGGRVVAQGSYDLARNDIMPVVTRTLGVDAGKARHRRVQQIVGSELKFEPQPLPDTGAIFAAGYQSLALRQVNPQLRFFNAQNLPVYITQEGIDTDTAANRDLEGMRFVDMPWALETTGTVADIRNATESAWKERGARQSRYFAFGYDAATLAVALRRGANNWPIDGLTGRLTLTAEGRIERSLQWARMREGVARPADPIAQ